MKKSELYDKKGYPVQQFDVLKMYHFTGARKKRHYMYKWVIEKDGRFYGCHLNRLEIKADFPLNQRELDSCEIVQGSGPPPYHSFEGRPRRKRAGPDEGMSDVQGSVSNG